MTRRSVFALVFAPLLKKLKLPKGKLARPCLKINRLDGFLASAVHNTRCPVPPFDYAAELERTNRYCVKILAEIQEEAIRDLKFLEGARIRDRHTALAAEPQCTPEAT